MESMWESRELRLLNVAVQHFDDIDAPSLPADELAEKAGLTEDETRRAPRNLADADPPYVVGFRVFGAAYPVALTDVTERARRAVGRWPTPENLADRIIAAL